MDIKWSLNRRMVFWDLFKVLLKIWTKRRQRLSWWRNSSRYGNSCTFGCCRYVILPISKTGHRITYSNASLKFCLKKITFVQDFFFLVERWTIISCWDFVKGRSCVTYIGLAVFVQVTCMHRLISTKDSYLPVCWLYDLLLVFRRMVKLACHMSILLSSLPRIDLLGLIWIKDRVLGPGQKKRKKKDATHARKMMASTV